MTTRRPKDRLKTWRACAFAGMNPAPVYIAHFADGHIRRMSFWSQVGKPIAPARGRALCLFVEGERRFTHGEVELDGAIVLTEQEGAS